MLLFELEQSFSSLYLLLVLLVFARLFEESLLAHGERFLDHFSYLLLL